MNRQLPTPPKKSFSSKSRSLVATYYSVAVTRLRFPPVPSNLFMAFFTASCSSMPRIYKRLTQIVCIKNTEKRENPQMVFPAFLALIIFLPIGNYLWGRVARIGPRSIANSHLSEANGHNLLMLHKPYFQKHTIGSCPNWSIFLLTCTLTILTGIFHEV